MKFVMAGGGTGGHVIPALAVAQELKRRGHDVKFWGTAHGYEARLVPATGFTLLQLNIGGLNRVGFVQKLRTLYLLPVSTLQVWAWMGRQRPGAVFSMGGYVAGPVVIAAFFRGIPVVAMEPNAVPGLTNQKAGRWLARALVNFEETRRYFPPGRSEVTGVPVRHEFFAIPSRHQPAPFTLLVTGGSQGSRTLNNAGRDSWALFAQHGMQIRIVHQAGRGNAAALQQYFRETGLEGEVIEFIQDMPSAFAGADVIVARSGASTVSELAAAGKPSILVPFPFAADNHQQRNAEAMERAGAARLVLDRDMNGDRLFQEISRLVNSPEERRHMGECARKLGRPGAAVRAAEVLEEVAVS